MIMKWNQDNILFTILSRGLDVCCASLLWLICSVPIITIGASSTALHAVMQKLCRDEGSGMTRIFFHSFKRNFRQATCIWLMMLVFLVVLWGDFYAFLTMNVIPVWFQIVPFFCGSLFLLLWVWVFSYLARFEGTLGQVLKNSLLMSVRHLGWSLLIILILALSSLAGMSIAILLIFIPGIYAYCKAIIQRRIFDRYEPGAQKRQ